VTGAERPVVVAGMHRSGTSLLAAFLQALGLHVGDRLLGADRNNPHGYFEDVGFLEFQRRLLAEMCPPGDGGWPDWGVPASGELDRSLPPRRRREALALAAARSGRGPWGWKDPRTTMLLDFWADLLPDAVFVLVFRRPVDVLDSVLRTEASHFATRPDHALAAWRIYNEAILAFVARSRGRCALFDVETLGEDPQDVTARVAALAGDALPALRDRDAVAAAHARTVDPRLLRRRPQHDPLQRWVAARAPEAGALYATLCEAAGGLRPAR
jgi:hypothetical protein